MSPRGGYGRAAGRELQLSLLTGMVRGVDFEKVLENPIPRQWGMVQVLPRYQPLNIVTLHEENDSKSWFDLRAKRRGLRFL